MANEIIRSEPALSQSGSLVVTFEPPARRLVVHKPVCGTGGSVVDVRIDSVRHYCRESPLIVQPDLLVDSESRYAIGLSFEISSPEWMLPRCHNMLQGLDATAIRICGLDSVSNDAEEQYFGLEILWGKPTRYERVFAQFDFGLWGFLYSSPTPLLFRDGTAWSVPAGLVIGDLTQIGVPLLVQNSESGDHVVRKAE